MAYMRFLIYNVASWATRVHAQEFHLSPTPQLYMQNVNLGSRLQAKYFHIYTSVSKLTESKYVPYIHINMHIQSYQS